MCPLGSLGQRGVELPVLLRGVLPCLHNLDDTALRELVGTTFQARGPVARLLHTSGESAAAIRRRGQTIGELVRPRVELTEPIGQCCRTASKGLGGIAPWRGRSES